MGKRLKEAKDEDNGQVIPSVQELLQANARNQQELSDRLSDLEETTSKGDDSTTKIQLAHMYMKPPDAYLSDLSFIPPLAVRSIAEALALDEMTNKQVRSGEISLNKLLIQNWLHALRGGRGKLLMLVADAMREQVSADAAKGEGEMPDFEAGKE